MLHEGGRSNATVCTCASGVALRSSQAESGDIEFQAFLGLRRQCLPNLCESTCEDLIRRDDALCLHCRMEPTRNNGGDRWIACAKSGQSLFDFAGLDMCGRNIADARIFRRCVNTPSVRGTYVDE